MAATRSARLQVRVRMLAVRTGFLLGRLRPVRPHVVLATTRSSRLGGNLKAIAEELGRREPSVPARALPTPIGTGLLGRARAVRDAAVAGWHLATARVFVVDDHYFPMYVITPRPGTIRVQTWHAAGALKKVGYSVLDKGFGADEELVGMVPIHTNYDLCLMPADATTPHYMDAFRQPRERFTSALGIPRTDLFFDEERRARATRAIRERYAIPVGRRVLLYAPTFRGESMHAARYDDHLDLPVLRAALGDEWVVLMRLHPSVRDAARVGPEDAMFVVDVSDWPDMNELMFVADLLVTDYSSAIFEFALLDRPMAFLAPDHEAYERERGFYVDYRASMPGPVFETTGDLAAYVREGSFDPDASRAFARASFDVADGRASARFVDCVVLPALDGRPLDPGLTRG
jgi:teichoic acid ribitol-phosphate primase